MGLQQLLNTTVTENVIMCEIDFYPLDELGFVGYMMRSDCVVVNTTTGKEIKSVGVNLVMFNKRHNHWMRVAKSKVFGYCYAAPWHSDQDFRSLAFLGYSKYYVTFSGHVFGTRNMQYLKAHLSHDGYHCVGMFKDSDKRQHQLKIHRLVALAYIENPDKKPSVNHINGNKNVNSADNLEWVTVWENDNHARLLGLRRGISDERIHQICKCFEQGMRQMDIVRALDVPRHIVKDIQRGSYYHISKGYKIPRHVKQDRLPLNLC